MIVGTTFLKINLTDQNDDRRRVNGMQNDHKLTPSFLTIQSVVSKIQIQAVENMSSREEKGKGKKTSVEEPAKTSTPVNESEVQPLPAEDPASLVSEAALSEITGRVAALVTELHGMAPNDMAPNQEHVEHFMNPIVNNVKRDTIHTTEQVKAFLSKAAEQILTGILNMIMKNLILKRIVDLNQPWCNQTTIGTAAFEEAAYTQTSQFGVSRYFLMCWATRFQRNKFRQTKTRPVKKNGKVYIIPARPLPPPGPPGMWSFLYKIY